MLRAQDPSTLLHSLLFAVGARPLAAPDSGFSMRSPRPSSPLRLLDPGCRPGCWRARCRFRSDCPPLQLEPLDIGAQRPVYIGAHGIGTLARIFVGRFSAGCGRLGEVRCLECRRRPAHRVRRGNPSVSRPPKSPSPGLRRKSSHKNWQGLVWVLPLILV